MRGRQTRALSQLTRLADLPLYVLRRRYQTADIRDAVLASTC
jgi:hypothetical protein